MLSLHGHCELQEKNCTGIHMQSKKLTELCSGYSLGFKKQIHSKSRNTCLADKLLLWFPLKWIRHWYVWDLGRVWMPESHQWRIQASAPLMRKGVVLLASGGVWGSCGGLEAPHVPPHVAPGAPCRPSPCECSAVPGWSSAHFWATLLDPGFSFQAL